MPSWFSALTTALETLLVRLGIPEKSGPVAALLLLYVAMTVLVLVVLLLVWRARRRQGGATPKAADAMPAPVSAPVVPEPPPSVPSAASSVPGSLRSGLRKTAATLLGRLEGVFAERHALRPEQFEELEEILVGADFGMATTRMLVTALEQRLSGQAVDSAEIFRVLEEEVGRCLQLAESPDITPKPFPEVIMVVGVNGVGKTTTIGKLACLYAAGGRKVLLAAADTFRAAAADQLAVWAERAGAGLVRHAEGGDPAAVVFDALQAAQARKVDTLVVDTAGRLHTKSNLMEELKKIRRVLDRAIPGAPHQTLLVVDATTGQNALVQARLFQEAVAVDGIVLTKLDGTARGGIAVAIAAELKIPVRFVGVGEGLEDLRPFDAAAFARALFARNDAA